MIDNKDAETLTINYFGVDWRLEGDKLICTEAHHANLFKCNPENLYINWAAAMQIQFHVSELDQDFSADIYEWSQRYLKHFVQQAKRRAETMIVKFVQPFEKYIT